MSKPYIVQSRRPSKVRFEKNLDMQASNSSQEEMLSIVRKSSKKRKTSCSSRSCDGNEDISNVSIGEMKCDTEFDFNDEFQNIMKGLNTTVNKCVRPKSKRVENGFSGAVNHNISKLTSLISSECENMERICSSFRKNYFQTINQLKNEYTNSNTDLESDITLILGKLHNIKKEESTQQKKFKIIDDTKTDFFKDIDCHNKKYKEKSAVCLNEFQKNLELFQKEIMKNAQMQEMMMMKRSLHSALW